MQYEMVAEHGTWHFNARHADDKTGYLARWRELHEKARYDLFQADYNELSEDSIIELPAYSFALKIQFALTTPYMSKDDASFYAIDNPVRKEHVFKMPMIASTSWKGALRAAFWQLGCDAEEEQVQRLFGAALDDDEGKRGLLQFFSTFFDPGRIVLEIINPHDRANGVGSNPIPFEAVSAGSRGVLWLLYTPLEFENDTLPLTTGSDLQMVAQVLAALLADYGIGAKTSLGYGGMRLLSGRLLVRAALPEFELAAGQVAAQQTAVQQKEAGLTEREQALIELCGFNEDGSIVDSDTFYHCIEVNWTGGKKPKSFAKKYGKLYKKLQKMALEPEEEDLPAAARPQETPQRALTVFEIRDFSSLQQIADHVADHLAAGERL